jgi:hypothetical protein
MPSKCELVHNHRRSFQTATQRLAIRARKAEKVTGFQPDPRYRSSTAALQSSRGGAYLAR